ncbi:MAG: DUF2817 domain-containing protein, partial [Bacteriovoracaceae bacterium]
MDKISELKPWGPKEKENWLKEQTIKRSYREEVVSKVETLKKDFEVVQYGLLSHDPERYPLFLVKSKNFDASKKNILVTGGVHGYETSGVQGALSFMKNEGKNYEKAFNFICVPCISPWGYETVNRWNPKAIDPNRSFYDNSPSQECSQFLQAISSLDLEIFAHFDLHETTDTDNTVFRPALEQRDGVEQAVWDIPDGFYLVGDAANPQGQFQKAIIDSVKQTT